MKRCLSIVLMAIITVAMLAGCAANNSEANINETINVISREPGSGTRGAFIELFKIEVKDANGNKKDMTSDEAIVQQKTDAVITSITGDKNAIGYISLGSLSENVKALEIDGVKANAENVKNSTYKIARPFIIATKGETTELTKDFINFILSAEGQAVVVADGRIAVADNASAYSGSKPSGKIVVGGSSSVSPTMEKLREAYIKINSNATIEIQTTDSSSGMTGVSEGTLNIGMSSRELKDSEKEKLTSIEIALDGIAVIVNNDNTVKEMTSEQVRQIFTGELTKWSEIE